MFECHQNGSLAKLFGPKADEGQAVKDAGRVPPREREYWAPTNVAMRVPLCFEF